MSQHIINSAESLQKFIGDVRSEYDQHKFIRATLKTGKDRSLDQNALSHAWYEQLARELREYDALGYKCYCKLHHGVPILRAEDEDFRAFYDTAMRKTLTYEQKISAMKFVPVTSEMTKLQLSKYLEAVQADFARSQVNLEFPKDE